MKKTKARIIEQAILLFNDRGIPNVKLQHIADACNISVGNLAYHFKFKEDLLQTVANVIDAEIAPIVDKEKHFPFLIDFDNQLSHYYSKINKYAFYFLDVIELERSYPMIHQQRVKYIGKMIDQIHRWTQENVTKAIFRKEIHEDQYAHTAHAIWMIISYWMTQKKVLSQRELDEEKFKIVVWNQLLPNFTEVGLMEYEALILPQLKNVEYAVERLPVDHISN